MKVLMTADAVGGVWTHVTSLAAALRRHGVDVALATIGPAPSSQQRADAIAAGVLELHVGDYRLEWMAEPWEDVDSAGNWLLALQRDTGADVVHLNGYAHAAFDWPVPVVVGAHSCVASWWRAVRGVGAPREWDEYRDRVRHGLAAADVTIFPTRALLAAMEVEYGEIPAARVVHNGLGAEVNDSPTKEPFVLATGRFWDEGKNLSILQDVGARIPWTLYVAGDCDTGRVAVRPHGVVALGRLERGDLRKWQRRAAIAVHPALYEPFGYGPLEAAREHCALVLADIPSLRELWDGAALFADPDDAAGLAAAVERLIAEPATLTVMRARAAKRAGEYTAERMARVHAQIYAMLVDAGSPGKVACVS